MEKEFVPYELAVKLKELGFEGSCLRWYDDEGTFVKSLSQRLICAAPLWQQAFDFFIYNYGLISIIETNGYSYIFKIQEITQYYVETVRGFETYQEARKDCLEKLIEIVENE